MRRALLIVSFTGVLLGLGAWPALAAPGNNGTVKIDGVEFDTHPNNEPHVGCVFQVDFYGYDEGDLEATASFSLHPPTGTDHLQTETADIGEDPAGGGTDLDAEITVDLTSAIIASGATPHPIQGYHVKLTVHAEGSIGADVKHKVFWVTGCDNYPPVPTDAGELAPLSGVTTFSDPAGPAWPTLAVIGVVVMGGLLVGRRAIRRRIAP